MSELLSRTREICRMFEIKPARSKGQNFLINEKIYDDIVKAADINKGDIVLEVGPGLGFLTARLAKAAGQVIAVELDDQLATYLQMAVDAQDLDNVRIVNQDILKFNVAKELPADRSYKIVANLPYNITSVFLRNFLSSQRQPASLVLMLQKEVAQRIVAQAPDMSLLALSVQYYAKPYIVREVKAGNFWPEPEVDSAVIRLDCQLLDSKDSAQVEADRLFFRIARSGFSAKRKMLKNNLSVGLSLDQDIIIRAFNQAGLKLTVRAEELSLENWRKLVAALLPFMV